MGYEQEKGGYINYMYLQEQHPTVSLYNIIRGNIQNRATNISPNDITILGCTTGLLRIFDSYYRYASRERTNSMIETVEVMYMTHLNYIGNNKTSNPNHGWFNNISEHFKKKLFPNRTMLSDNDKVKLRQRIAVLFTLFDLYTNYGETFKTRLEEECAKCGIALKAFLAFRKHYEASLQTFRELVYSYDYKNIRDNKKLHFWMNSGTIKLSTIHSFKGWESEVVFLIIEPNYNSLSFDELLYTGLTRCRRSLVVINYGNKAYNERICPLFRNMK